MAWICVPVCLLLLACGTTIFVVVSDTGGVDFTNPVAMALIGIGSPSDPIVMGACTGEYYDGKVVNELEHFKHKPRRVRLAYGVERLLHARKPHLQFAVLSEQPNHPSMASQLERPIDGEWYV